MLFSKPFISKEKNSDRPREKQSYLIQILQEINFNIHKYEDHSETTLNLEGM